MRIIHGIICALLLSGLASAGSPPIIQTSSGQREQIQSELTTRPTDTLVDTVRQIQNQMQLLTDEMASLSRSHKALREECALRMGKLQNDVWALKNPGVTYPGQPATTALRTGAQPPRSASPRSGASSTTRIVSSFKGDYDGQPNPSGAWLITVDSEGTKRRWQRREPVRRVVAAVAAPIRRVMAPVQRPMMMFGGGMGGAACAGGS